MNVHLVPKTSKITFNKYAHKGEWNQNYKAKIQITLFFSFVVLLISHTFNFTISNESDSSQLTRRLSAILTLPSHTIITINSTILNYLPVQLAFKRVSSSSTLCIFWKIWKSTSLLKISSRVCLSAQPKTQIPWRAVGDGQNSFTLNYRH